MEEMDVVTKMVLEVVALVPGGMVIHQQYLRQRIILAMRHLLMVLPLSTLTKSSVQQAMIPFGG